jgi:hypothetical protein
MKKLISICLPLCLAACAVAQDLQNVSLFGGSEGEKVVHVYDWQDLMAQHSFPNSEVISMDGVSVLKITKTNDTPFAPLEITLLTITNSSLINKIDSINFDAKYENIPYSVFMERKPGEAARWVGSYMALWSHYAPEAQGGDLNSNSLSFNIEGTSNWKPQLFSLSRSVYIDGTAVLPIRVDLKIILPETGTVYLRPIKLMGRSENWWSPRTSGLIGGIGGSVIGCLGGLIGILASMGRGRRFVLATTVILIATGILLVIAGVVAVAMKQPYAVWYPLLLGGAILTFALGVNLYSIKRRYDDLEIRRMTSMDTTGH